VGIAPAPRGVPQIDVAFEVDSNGILHVSAKDQKSGKLQEIRVTPSSGLSQDEVLRMKEEAKFFSQKDLERKEQRLALNRLDGLIKNVQRSYNEYGYLLSPDKSNSVKNTLNESTKILNQLDLPLASIESTYQELEKAGMEITNAMLASPGVGYSDGDQDSQTKMEQLLREAMQPQKKDEP